MSQGEADLRGTLEEMPLARLASNYKTTRPRSPHLHRSMFRVPPSAPVVGLIETPCPVRLNLRPLTFSVPFRLPFFVDECSQIGDRMAVVNPARPRN